MPHLSVGLPSLTGDIETYAARYDLVEVRPIDTSLPKPAALRKWRKAVPPSFVFSVILPRAVASLDLGTALDAALEESLAVANALEARCVVLQTPPDVRPTSANKKKLAALFAKIPPEGTVRCWEPMGIWERDEIVDVARSLDVIAVLDAARDPLPPGNIAYTRLRALGELSALGAATIEKVADRLRKRREAFVVVEGKGNAKRVGTALREALAKKPARAPGATIVRPSAQTLVADDEEQ